MTGTGFLWGDRINGKYTQRAVDRERRRILETPWGTTSEENPVSPWTIKKVMLWRDKSQPKSTSVSLVKRVVLPQGVADPEREWYVQVSVVNDNIIHFVGEVILPEDGSNPHDEINRLTELAHGRAEFLNIHRVELVS